MTHLQLILENKRICTNTFNKLPADNCQQATINRINYKLHRPQRSFVSQGNTYIFIFREQFCKRCFPCSRWHKPAGQCAIFLPLATTALCVPSVSAQHERPTADSGRNAAGSSLLLSWNKSEMLHEISGSCLQKNSLEV